MEYILNYCSEHLDNKNFKYCGPAYGEYKDELIYSSDILVLPSYSENFGLVIPESIIRGVPVIYSKHTPWDDIISNKYGWSIELNQN